MVPTDCVIGRRFGRHGGAPRNDETAMTKQNVKLIEDVLREEPVRFLCQNPAIVERTATMKEVVDRLREDSGGCVVIVDGPSTEDSPGRPVGIFTERDYLDKIATLNAGDWQDAKKVSIGKFMTAKLHSLAVDDRLDDVIRLMTRRGYRHLPIVNEDGTLLGVVSAGDIIGYLAEFFPMEVYNLPPGTTQEHDQVFETREGG